MQIQDLEAQQKAMVSAQKTNIITEIREKIVVYGLTEKDLFGKVAAKYRHDGKEWSGRGKRPLWFQSAIDAGVRVEDMKCL